MIHCGSAIRKLMRRIVLYSAVSYPRLKAAPRGYLALLWRDNGNDRDRTAGPARTGSTDRAGRARRRRDWPGRGPTYDAAQLPRLDALAFSAAGCKRCARADLLAQPASSLVRCACQSQGRLDWTSD